MHIEGADIQISYFNAECSILLSASYKLFCLEFCYNICQ